MSRGSNQQLGSCQTFPIEGSGSDSLRFGCFTTTNFLCNQLNNVFQANKLGFEARFNPNLACDPNVTSLDSSGVLNTGLKILREYSNQDHLQQRYGTQRPPEVFLLNECPSGTTQVEECCYGDCDKPIGLCLHNNKLDVQTLCDNTYKSAFKGDGRKTRSGNTVLKSQNTLDTRRIDSTLVPQSRSVVSGIGCRDGECLKIPDLYQYIQSSRVIDYTFYPYDDQTYNKLTMGNIDLPAGQTPRDHFITMYTEGGHGINRPMTIDEMYNAHSDDTNLSLTRNDIALMVSTYEVEATFGADESKLRVSLSDCANSTSNYRDCLECVSNSAYIDKCTDAIKKTRCYAKHGNNPTSGGPFCDDVIQNCEVIPSGTPESRCYPFRDVRVTPNSESCVCDIQRSIETEEVFVSFPKTNSPTNAEEIKITVPVGEGDFVARKLGGVRRSTRASRKLTKENFDTNLNRKVSIREIQNTNEFTGLCVLSDTTTINTDLRLCNELGGEFFENPFDSQEFNRDILTVNKNSISYERTQSSLDSCAEKTPDYDACIQCVNNGEGYFGGDFCSDAIQKSRCYYKFFPNGREPDGRSPWCGQIVSYCDRFQRDPESRCFKKNASYEAIEEDPLEDIIQSQVENDARRPALDYCSDNTPNYRDCLDCVSNSPYTNECEDAIKKTRCYFKYNPDRKSSPYCSQVRANCDGFQREPESRCFDRDISNYDTKNAQTPETTLTPEESTLPSSIVNEGRAGDIYGDCHIVNPDYRSCLDCVSQGFPPTDPCADTIKKIKCYYSYEPMRSADSKKKAPFCNSLNRYGCYWNRNDPLVSRCFDANYSNLPDADQIYTQEVNGFLPQESTIEDSPEGPFAVYGTSTFGTGFYYPMYTTAEAARAANLSGFDKVESTGFRDGLLYHTHYITEYPDIVFYMPDDQLNHGVSDSGGYRIFRGDTNPTIRGGIRSTSTPPAADQTRDSGYSPPSAPPTPPPSSPPPSGGGGGGYGGY